MDREQKPRGRVLVTGAAGFIGSHLVDALLAAGQEVVGLDHQAVDANAANANLAGALRHPKFTPVRADIATDDLDAAIAGCEVVYHLAAVPGVRSSWGRNFGRYTAANVLGTQRILVACTRLGVPRLVYASSSSVYGVANGPSRETDRLAPLSPYGVTKLTGEHLAAAYVAGNAKAPTTAILRYFTVYGPRQRPDMAIGRILQAALTEQPFTVFGDGTQTREFTYVSDVVDATIAAASVDADVAIFNVGGGSSQSLADVLDTAAAVTGRSVPIRPSESQAGDVPATRADLTRAVALLGYQPKVRLHEGMTRHVDWLRDRTPAAAGSHA
ncbi:NAD-dependent epimerase/dehydratase family protein [Micromonospora sp. LOL_024]|uniref:NAD-dependent epimerase/dehydratase family protein n=1 Tax=Micromonospora sp. LOL_024 TaxID=3345412 RepID=UPI003A8C378F